MCSEAISGQTAGPICIPRPDSERRIQNSELTPKFRPFFQSEGGLNWLQPEVMKMMQFYLMNLAILRDLKIGRLNLLNVPEMNFLTFWGLSGVELDAKVNVPTGVKKNSLPVGRPSAPCKLL